MKILLIKNTRIANICEFASLADAQSFPGYTAAAYVDGAEIGDTYVDGTLTKYAAPETPEQAEIRLLKAQKQALSDRADFLEDCVAEMAQIVYA